MKIVLVALLAACSALAMQPAHGKRTLEIKDVSPKPAVLRGGVAEVTVSVHAKWGTPENCSAAVHAEENTVPPLMFGPGLPQTQEIHLKFYRPGSYKVRVGSSAGDGGVCGTIAQTVVRVIDEATGKAAPARLRCPEGWSMASSSGAKFTCRLIPPPPLACEDGTTFYSQGTQIGCR